MMSRIPKSLTDAMEEINNVLANLTDLLDKNQAETLKAAVWAGGA